MHEILWICYYNIVYHLENAEMTPELCDDLINFSFNNLSDVTKHNDEPHPMGYNVHYFAPLFLECLQRLVCYHIYSCILCIFIL
jgi:hypothetical protein